MIRYLLDTNILILVMTRRDTTVMQRFATLPQGSAAISCITAGELALGWEKSARPKTTREQIEPYFDALPVLPIDTQVALEYGKLRAELEKAGTPIGMNDTWLAAQCRHIGATLVSRNQREFARVRGLETEAWE